jgi:hypothetical protein
VSGPGPFVGVLTHLDPDGSSQIVFGFEEVRGPEKRFGRRGTLYVDVHGYS